MHLPCQYQFSVRKCLRIPSLHTQLENGEIDILGGISYTDERAENMLFSDMPMGEEKYYIYTDASNMDLTAGNLDSFEGKNIGVLKDNITEDV